MRRSLVASVVVVVATIGTAADRPEGPAFQTRSATIARNGMVAAAHPLAVQIGIDVLKRGGSAVDAAIAVNAALALMEPVSCGLGGDLFAMVWDPEAGKLFGLNGSGRAPGVPDPRQGPGNQGRHDPTTLAVRLDRTGRRRRLVRAARPLRPPADARGPRADDRVRP